MHQRQRRPDQIAANTFNNSQPVRVKDVIDQDNAKIGNAAICKRHVTHHMPHRMPPIDGKETRLQRQRSQNVTRFQSGRVGRHNLNVPTSVAAIFLQVANEKLPAAGAAMVYVEILSLKNIDRHGRFIGRE